MKKLFLLGISVAMVVNCFAQEPEGKRSAFHLSFFPPMSTHGSNGWEYTNTVSFNILAGVSKNEEAFSFAGLANIVKNNANGLQFAGLLNYAGNNGRGVMFSGLANIVGNDYKGFQFAGLFNKAGTASGVQFAGLGNYSQNVKGLQFGGLGNIAENIHGVQFGGVGNIARDVKGLQFGGVFNVARNVSGVQFAGLINVAETSDCPIAILNIIKNGQYGVAFSYNDMGSIVASFRSGGRYTYGILGAGYNHKANDKGFVTEAGYGARIFITDWLRINNELKAGSIGNFSDSSTFYSNYALLPAFRISRNFELFGGPSINYISSDNIANANLFPSNSLWKKHTDKRLQQLYIGYQAGIQIVL